MYYNLVIVGFVWGIICVTCSSICIFKDYSTILDERLMVRSKSSAEMHLHVFKSSTWSLVKSFSDVWPEIKLFSSSRTHLVLRACLLEPIFSDPSQLDGGTRDGAVLSSRVEKSSWNQDNAIRWLLKNSRGLAKNSLCQPYVLIWGFGWASTLEQGRKVKESWNRAAP